MALSSASRASSLKHINIKFMARNGTSQKFYFYKLHKSWRRHTHIKALDKYILAQKIGGLERMFSIFTKFC